MKRKGCIYSEEQRNLGKGRVQNGRGVQGCLTRGVGWTPQSRRRWVAEISDYGVRHRFRSTCYGNVASWLVFMSHRFSD